MDEARQAKLTLAQEQGVQQQLVTRQRDLRELEAMLGRYDRDLQELSKKRQEYSAHLQDYTRKRQHYDMLDNAFLQAQAGILAQTLTVGAPCPVCGSLEHPQPAVLPQDAPTQQQVKQAQAQLTSAREYLGDLAGQGKKLGESCERQKELLLQKSGELLTCMEFEVVAQRLQQELLNVNTKAQELTARLRPLQQLAGQETKRERDVNKQKQLNVDAEAAAQERQTELAKVQGQLDEKKRQLAEQQKMVEELDEAALRAESSELSDSIKALENEDRRLYAAVANNKQIAVEVRKASEQLAQSEQEYQSLKVLADTMNGKLTSKKHVNLETYIQMHYLDKILRRANLRLMQMTCGQYELCRESLDNNEVKTGNSKTGLDLVVQDHYSGRKRSVKTLSGGESFMASLALALGLADEVQSSAGGIQLDAMFVDEGFGSLDDAALQQAIATLQGLSEGHRLVGIISHVHELMDMIDMQLIVTKKKAADGVGSQVHVQL